MLHSILNRQHLTRFTRYTHYKHDLLDSQIITRSTQQTN